MGLDVADCTGSGRPSLFVTNFQRELHALYRNEGGERFAFASEEFGLAELPKDLVGFGTAFLDSDRDGWEDLVLVHGHVVQHPPFGGRMLSSVVTPSRGHCSMTNRFNRRPIPRRWNSVAM